MAKIITVFTTILIFAFTISNAQNINVKTFRSLPNDQTARVHEPEIDQNGEKCALIKVVTNQKGFVWEGGTLGITKVESKTGEYWVYIPRGAKKITIKHDKLGVLRDYLYPEAIKKATVFEMVLTTAEVETIVKEESIKSQWLIISSQPNGADVYINNNHKGQTPFQMELKEGKYTYRVNKEMYHPEAGKFNLVASEGKKQIDLQLKPAFGYANITTKPVDKAEISIDGDPTDKKTPFKTDRIKSGMHTITAKYPMYHESKKTIKILDGKTTDVVLNLDPAFGTMQITSEPESGATVLLNGENTGKTTPCSLDELVSGEHMISLKKKWYEPVKKKINIKDGQQMPFTIKMKPTFGIVKVATDKEAEIYIDNENKGTHKWEGRLVAGIHTIEAQREKHQTDSQKIELNVNQIKTIKLNPTPKTGVLKIKTDPFEARIILNGKDYGRTPLTINDLLIGNHTLILKKEGYGDLRKGITIREGKTLSLDEILQDGKIVTITTNPSGAELFIDGEYKGKTPFDETLSFGKHDVKLINGNRKSQKIIAVEESAKSNWSYDLQEIKKVTFTSNPSTSKIYIDGGYKGVTPLSVMLPIGEHMVVISKEKFNSKKTYIEVNHNNDSFELKMRPETKYYNTKGGAYIKSAILPGWGSGSILSTDYKAIYQLIYIFSGLNAIGLYSSPFVDHSNDGVKQFVYTHLGFVLLDYTIILLVKNNSKEEMYTSSFKINPGLSLHQTPINGKNNLMLSLSFNF